MRPCENKNCENHTSTNHIQIAKGRTGCEDEDGSIASCRDRTRHKTRQGTGWKRLGKACVQQCTKKVG